MRNYNPFRYRGYYATETGFYYLQSRYYDPTIKRFLNADAFASTGQGFLGYNMFAYCNNSPVAEKDEHGGLPHTTLELTNPNEVPPIVVLGSDTTGEVQDKQLERRDEGIAVSYDPKKKVLLVVWILDALNTQIKMETQLIILITGYSSI